MTWIFIAVGGTFAVIDWYAVWKKNRNIEAFAKPFAMILLIIWALITGFVNDGFEFQMLFIILGLVLCLAGDIFLFLPPEKYFIYGLLAFLAGHISYILGFGWFENIENNFIPILFLAVVIIIVSWQVMIRIIQAIRKQAKNMLIIPIIIYAIVISIMLFFAGLRFFDTGWTTVGAFLVSLGALFFYVSDVLNAWERFVQKFQHDRLIIMMLYHLGQYGIAIGAILQITGRLPG